MDNELLISQIAEREGPTVMRAGYLVTSLRTCLIYATSRTASRLSIVSSDGESSLLSSKLMSISNGGLDALADVVKFLHDLRKTAESMTGPEGTLENLRTSFGNPAERQTHERLRKRLENQAAKCRAAGWELEDKLKGWKLEIKDFCTAVMATRGVMEASIEDCDTQIGRLGYEKTIKAGSLHETRGKEVEAQLKYERLRGDQQSFLNSIRVPRSFSPWDIGLSVFSFGWSRFRSGLAAGDIKHLQEEAERMRRATEEFELDIAEAQVSLQSLSGKNTKLQEFTNGLELTLRALVCFTENVTVLSIEFSKMDSDVKELLETHDETNEMSVVAAGGNVIPLSEVKGFSDNVQSMSKKAIIVENLAWLYADVIQGVMMGGLEDLTRGYGSTAEQHQSLDRAISDGGQSQQLQIASSDNSSCITMAVSTKVDYVGQGKMNALNERNRIFAEKLNTRENTEVKAARKKNRNFFGRQRSG